MQAGERHCRDRRGYISRPTVGEVLEYREHVDRAMARLLEEGGDADRGEIERRTVLGIHHEQQHQELLLTDIKHVFSVNPLRPAYHDVRPVEESEPVAHLSYYEADAFGRWAGARLPTEAEWEVAAGTVPVEGNFVGSGLIPPAPASSKQAGGEPGGLRQMFGDVWEWTRSQYEPYPGFRPLEGALGKYNGKFMYDQFVLRGGSCATSQTHIRPTYRNFFHAAECWQFTGLRLARDGP